MVAFYGDLAKDTHQGLDSNPQPSNQVLLPAADSLSFLNFINKPFRFHISHSPIFSVMLQQHWLLPRRIPTDLPKNDQYTFAPSKH